MTFVFVREHTTARIVRYAIGALVFCGGVVIVLVALRMLSAAYAHDQALRAVAREEYEAAYAAMTRASERMHYDRYFRTRAQIRQLQIRALLASSSDTLDEAQFELFSTWANDAIDQALRAAEQSPDEGLNWIIVGNAYAQLVPLGIEGADARAREAYERARTLNPTDPAPLVLLARVTEDPLDAKRLIEEALVINPQYAPAREAQRDAATLR